MAEGRGWWRDAACARLDPEIFFDPAKEKQAKAVCANCSVRQPCLLEERGGYGVFGGFSENERQTFHSNFIT